MTTSMFALTVSLAVVALTLWFVWRYYSIPQTTVFHQIRTGMNTAQRYAIDHIGENLVPVGPAGPVAPGGRFLVGDVVTFVYSVSEENGMFVHLFSGKLHRWRPKRWLIACMLLSMLEFEKQIQSAGITFEKGMKQLAAPPSGTIFVQYAFTPDQHKRFVNALLSQTTQQACSSGRADCASVEIPASSAARH